MVYKILIVNEKLKKWQLCEYWRVLQIIYYLEFKRSVRVLFFLSLVIRLPTYCG